MPKIEILSPTTLEEQQKEIKFVLPMDPVQLCNYLLGIIGPARLEFSTGRIVLGIPAGFSIAVPFNCPPGFIVSAYAPTRITSNYYHEDIICSGYIGRNRRMFTYRSGVLLTEPLEIPPQALFGLSGEVWFVFDNYTSEDIRITITLNVFGVELTLWRKIVPILSLGYDKLNNMASRYVALKQKAPEYEKKHL